MTAERGVLRFLGSMGGRQEILDMVERQNSDSSVMEETCESNNFLMTEKVSLHLQVTVSYLSSKHI